jgi:ABC-type amino acid transport substrate-binding protein
MSSRIAFLILAFISGLLVAYLLLRYSMIPPILSGIVQKPISHESSQQERIKNNVSTASDKALENVKKSGMLRIGLEPDSPPIYFLNKDGKEDGFDYKFASLIADELGVKKIEVVEKDYDALPALLQLDKVDLIMGGYVPDDTIQDVEWSDSYYDFGLCLIVKQGSSIKNINQLKNSKIGLYKDPAAESWVKEHIPNTGGISYYQGVGWFKNLDDSTVDAIIYDQPFAAEEIKEFNHLKIVAYNLNKSSYAIGIKKGNTSLRDEVNKAIVKVKASEKYGKMIEKYFPSEIIPPEPDNNEKIYIVKDGDYLKKIAKEQLGDEQKWGEVWEKNKNRIADENLIHPGDKLILP